LSLFFLKRLDSINLVLGLCVGVVLAFFSQWFITFPKSLSLLTNNINFKQLMKFKFFSPDIKKLLKPFGLSIIGVSAVQINTALDACFSRVADPSGPAYLWYAIRLQQLPIALFGIALSGALLPPLARAYKENDISRFCFFLKDGLLKSSALMIPAFMGILVLGGASLNLIYGRGNFTNAALIETLYCLWGYSLALPFTSFIFLISNAFYAKKSYLIPSLISVVSVLFNVICNSFFVFFLHWKSYSVAISTSLSAILNCLLLFLFINKEKISVSFFDVRLIKIIISSISAFFITIFVGKFFINDPSFYFLLGKQGGYLFDRQFSLQIGNFLCLFGVFFMSLFLIAKIINAKDILGFLKRTT
jgi:putative peptidoglycan lipid II flippase